MKKILFLILFFSQIIVLAQKSPADSAVIRLVAKAYGDSVVLRWAPSTPAAWQMLNKTGYKILRMQKNSSNNGWTVLKDNLLPLSLEEMKKGLDRNNPYAAIAAQALYGKTIYAEKKGMAPVVKQNADILNDRFALALQSADYSAPVAKAIALGFTDRSVEKGESYIYKIVPAGNSKTFIAKGYSLIVVNEKEAALHPEGLTALGADRKVELQWPRSQAENYSAYQIEISEDGESFRSLHESPFFSSMPDTSVSNADSLVQRLTALLRYNHIYIDSLKKNYQTYYYRIRGINAFGEWSAYSDVISVSGRDLTPPSSVFLGTPEPAGKKSIKLNWVKPVKEGDLQGFLVYRSRQVDADYVLLNKQPLPIAANNFIDNDAFEHGPNFYIVAAIDTASNQNPSIPVMGLLPDTTAPMSPTGLAGSIDPSGLVHLKWKSNSEEDIKGYKIYFSHNPVQEFVQISLYPSPENQFTDSITLNTLTDKIYYRIVAVDQNNNHSDWSSILELKKPDIIPPTPPVILNSVLITKGVQLDFTNSASSDAIRYQIYRKEGNTEWKPVATILHNENGGGFSYRDTTIRRLTVYEYAAKTIDDDSLQSALCTPVRIELKGTEELKAVSFSKSVYDASQKAVVLQWNYPGDEVQYFVIYRALAGESLERYRNLEKTMREWKDLQADQIEKGYRYAIQAVYKNNSKLTRIDEGILVKK